MENEKLMLIGICVLVYVVFILLSVSWMQAMEAKGYNFENSVDCLIALFGPFGFLLLLTVTYTAFLRHMLASQMKKIIPEHK